MRRVGINPKRWFYDFREALDPEDLRQVLAGAAAEQWLNAEFFKYLAPTLPSDLTVYPEWGKHDLALLNVVDGAVNWDEAVAVLEVKFIYLGYGPKKIREYIQTLLRQMSTALDYPTSAVSGWVFAIYAYWNHRRPRLDFADFRQRVGTILKEELAKSRRHKIAAARSSLETYLPLGTVNVGGASATVGVAAQYLTARSV